MHTIINQKPEIILASTSPRRHLLLRQANIKYLFIEPEADELMPQEGNFGDTVVGNSLLKARSAADQVKLLAELPSQEFEENLTPNFERSTITHLRPDQLISLPVLGADTIVDLEGKALGKPADEQEAFSMLSRLSGNEHQVHSGIVLIDMIREQIFTRHVTTKVCFRELSVAEIESYIDSGEPMDKAGAYGIQARGSLFIDHLEGCFFNVMGLSVSQLWTLLQEVYQLRGPTNEENVHGSAL